MAVKLSVCIPTYNRSDNLKECLNSIFLSLKGHEKQVEIVISNNASTDNTETIVTEFQKIYPQLRYHRNQINIGGERNFYTVANLAEGEYIWVFGDDDRITVRAIPTILKQIESGYNLIISNYSMWSKDFSVVQKNRCLRLKQDKVFGDPNQLMKQFGLHLGYISSVIIRKSIFFILPREQYETFVEYGFPFVYSVYIGMAQHCYALYISEPLVCNRSGNSGEYDWYKYFVTGSTLIFNTLSTNGYSPSAIHAAKHQVLRDCVISHITLQKRQGNRNLKGVIKLIFPPYKGHWLFWAVCLPILYAPGFMVKILREIVVKYRRIGDRPGVSVNAE